MKPREIEVHIEELVLHGYAPGQRRDVGDALEPELRRLLVERGIPRAWQVSPEKIDAVAIQDGAQAKPATAGEQIARAVYGGSAR